MVKSNYMKPKIEVLKLFIHELHSITITWSNWWWRYPDADTQNKIERKCSFTFEFRNYKFGEHKAQQDKGEASVVGNQQNI